MSVPVLETERLRLRGHTAGDFPASTAMWAHPVVVRHFGGIPVSEEDCWSRLLRYIGHWQLLGFGYWVVEEKTTGCFVGEVGWCDYHRNLQPSLHGIPEVGWVLAPSSHGKGYATKAVGAVLAWGDTHFGLVRTACIIHPENAPSIRVAEKSGFRAVAQSTYKQHPITVYYREAGPR